MRLGIVRGVGAGAVMALVLACGASRPPASAPLATAPTPGTTGDAASRREAIEALDAAITADFASLGIARPPAAIAVAGCAPGAACATALRQGTELPRADPTCTPGKAQKCQDTCTLADSVCTNAGTICTIAGELGAADTYANATCAAAKTSCDTASDRCCGCV